MEGPSAREAEDSEMESDQGTGIVGPAQSADQKNSPESVSGRGSLVSNTEVVGSPEAGSRLITDKDLDRAAQDVRVSLEEMLHRVLDKEGVPSLRFRPSRNRRRVQREKMAPMTGKEAVVERADARGSVSARTPEVFDRFGRCAACGRRQVCCQVCHTVHDYLMEAT